MALSGITPQMGDIQFNFENSCNCCRLKPAEPEKKMVYVNSRGNLEPYSPLKARKDVHTSSLRSLYNLRVSLEQKIEMFGGDTKRFSPILSEVGRYVSENNAANIAFLNRINDLIENHFSEVSSEVSSERSV